MSFAVGLILVNVLRRVKTRVIILLVIINLETVVRRAPPIVELLKTVKKS